MLLRCRQSGVGFVCLGQINYWDVLRFRRADGTSKNDVSSTTHNVEWEMASKHMLGAREAGMCLSRLQFSFFFFSIYISRSHLHPHIMTMLIVQFRVDWIDR